MKDQQINFNEMLIFLDTNIENLKVKYENVIIQIEKLD